MKDGWKIFLILWNRFFEVVNARREKRNCCSYCGVFVLIETDGVHLLVLQKWVSCIVVELKDSV